MSVNEKMTAIADNIRTYTEGTEPLTLDDMAAQIPQVFDAGVKSEYDRFWDNYQENGNRTNYSRAFSNGWWNNELFKPKYDICPVQAETLFYTNNSITDPEAVLNALGLKLDFSRCTNFVQFLSWAAVQRLGIVDTRSATTLRLAFYAADRLQTIEKLILAEDGSQTIESSTSFANVPKLREIRIEGLFGQSVSFYSSSLLSLESLRSIINALKDYSGTGTTQTITLNPTSKSYLTDNDIAQITQKGWTLA